PWNSLLNDTTSGDSCIKKQSTPALPGLAGGSASQNANGGAAVTTTGSTPSGACGSTSGLNCSSAVSYLTSHANPLNDYTGKCAQYVRLAIAAGGLSSFSSGQGNAYQYGSILTAAKFTAVYSGTYSSSSGTAFSYQEGDVIVFQPVSGHPYGHIAMYTGSQWVSDALQSNMASNQADYQGGSFTVYRP
ncbi:MAG: hypothetical protein P4M11_12750, partial [Candidatus Pacebacteria bacterium]|nr:hypothetical protein [Candidatus Paceibacterota bacterium]